MELGYEKVVVDVGEVAAFDFGSTKSDLVLAEVHVVEPVADIVRRPRVKVRRLHFFRCFGAGRCCETVSKGGPCGCGFPIGG